MGEPALHAAWRFDQFVLNLSSGGLCRITDEGAHEPVQVGGRALDVLAALVTRSGEIVPKQTLMDAVWPGVSVEEKNLTMQISALRRVLDQGRSSGSCIQTVPGRGYRLAVPAERLLTAEPPASPAPATDRARITARRFSVRVAVPAMLLVILLVSAAGLFGRETYPHRSFSPPRLSVTVLPFSRAGPDTQDDRSGAAFTQALANDLSHIPGATLVAASPAEAGPMDARGVGKKAGVRYAVLGTLRNDAGMARVTAELISTETAAHLWSEHLEQSIADDAEGEAVLVRRLGQGLAVAMLDTESARSKRERPTNPDAFDLLLQARALNMHNMGPRQRDERIRLLEQSLALDPSSPLALTQLANELIRRYNYAESGVDDLERATGLIADARTINPNHAAVLETAAYLLAAQGRTLDAIAAEQRLLDEYPNMPGARVDLAQWLMYAGRAQEALPLITAEIHRDPLHARIWSRYSSMGLALLMLERDEEAIAWTRRALAANPSEHPSTRANLNLRVAAAQARLGQFDLAHQSVVEANRIWPYDTVRMHWPDDPNFPVSAAQYERFQAALRLAGHRDHADEDADFGVASDGVLHGDVVGLTPSTVPGAKIIHTGDLKLLLDRTKPIVIDSLLYSWGRSIPGAVGLKYAGMGSSISDRSQERLRQKFQQLTSGNPAAPIIAVGFNSERFDGRNLALRLVALGYTNVQWYRGGREAWEAAGLPETQVTVEDW